VVLGFPQEILGDSTKAGGIELLTNLATSVGINGTAFAAGNDTALAYPTRPPPPPPSLPCTSSTPFDPHDLD
jgi:hypothetical protein